jgi:alpha-glucoside transport system permease protein
MITKIVNAVVTVLAGVGAALILYYVLNKLANLFPGRWKERVRPFFFIAPAIAAIGLYLVYPAVQTIIFSFANTDSTAFIGVDNYRRLLSSSTFRGTLFNTLLWIIVVPALVIVFGLIVAVLADRLRPRGEKLAKTIIFFPMAISAVGASVIWRFVYAAYPEGQPQLGLQNAVIGVFGADPVNWLQLTTLRANSFLLMVVLLWMQVGFSMVLLSAAIKGVPGETLEAARIDGANERQIFRRVIIPQIRGTIITVFVTVTITVMKLFDVVYVMTNGNFNTNIVGNEFFNQLFTNFDNGAAAAIVVMLMIAIIPLMIYQVRQFRLQEAAR